MYKLNELEKSRSSKSFAKLHFEVTFSLASPVAKAHLFVVIAEPWVTILHQGRFSQNRIQKICDWLFMGYITTEVEKNVFVYGCAFRGTQSDFPES